MYAGPLGALFCVCACVCVRACVRACPLDMGIPRKKIAQQFLHSKKRTGV